ncbi:putative 1-deoxy-D-xylulose-5-phosphate reductoisomerase [Helianthus anomalus]
MPEIIHGDECVVEASQSYHFQELCQLKPFKVLIRDLIQVARHPDCVTIVTRILGCAGLKLLQLKQGTGKQRNLNHWWSLFVLPLARNAITVKNTRYLKCVIFLTWFICYVFSAYKASLKAL